MYERLADFLFKSINFHRVSVILEAGCGSGQLTIPFAKKVMVILEEFEIIAFDVSTGPYKGTLKMLKERLKKEGLEKFVIPLEGDVRNMKAIDKESVDLIISNELFCDLDREGLERALKEFYRILKHNGQMAHGELNPVPENNAQKLLMEADSYSMETLTPKYEWFSPFSDEVAAIMHKIGFKDITVKYFETNVRLPFNEAIKQLKEWNINPTFIEKRMEELKKHGLELPIEHVIFCKK
jgi:ubiquinone/menaquinone biosynthesis C-methylase UbiE